MAREVQRFSAVIPAGTAKASPVQINFPMPPRVIERIEIVVPPGPRGEVGFQLGSGPVQVIPTTPGQFVVTDNEIINWPLTDQFNSGAWSMLAYNTGTYNHSLEVRFHVNLVPAPVQFAGFQPLPNDAITAA